MPKNKGFTLVELLVVIAIIATLAVMGFAVYSGIQARARDARRRVDIEVISKAWEIHRSSNNPHYPTLQTSWFSNGNIPVDPINSAPYIYSGADTNIDTYEVCAKLESGTQYCIQNQQ